MEIFKRAERVLRRSGESVYLSPEGKRVTTGEIGAFNKGSFHLATALRAPIVPFYIATPPEVDPGMGNCAGPGRQCTCISNRQSRLPTGSSADLVGNKERIRQHFLEWHNEYR